MSNTLTKTKMGKKELWEKIRDYKFNNLVPQSTFENIIEALGSKNVPVRAFANKIRSIGFQEHLLLKLSRSIKNLFISVSSVILL